jgi:hypothetical protein
MILSENSATFRDHALAHETLPVKMMSGINAFEAERTVAAISDGSVQRRPLLGALCARLAGAALSLVAGFRPRFWNLSQGPAQSMIL